MCLFVIFLSTCYVFFYIYQKKNKLNISKFYKDSITFQTNIMHTLTNFNHDKGSLDCLSIYSFLFLNKKGSSLYNVYDWNEVKNKLVIKID